MTMELSNIAVLRYASRMSRSPPSLLSRLRVHRGAWLVCVLTLAFKLFASSVCMADDGLATLSDRSGSPQVVAVSDAAELGLGNAGCVLGETGGCHCACAHAVPLPPLTTAPTPVAVLSSSEWPPIAPHCVPAHTASLLRPPIA
jgi:hypothetical protein